MYTSDKIIQHIRQWINDVVIGCNFCPFAARVVKQNAVQYTVVEDVDESLILQTILDECLRLDENDAIETTLIIIPNGYDKFIEYLNLVEKAELIIVNEDYEGVYQVASFHPHYLFAGARENDAENYTNRSPYPMLHLLREDSLASALKNFPDPESIPEKNIQYAKQKGLMYMQALRAACMK